MLPITPDRIRRFTLAAAGGLSVALGTLGIFVPGLPTTVFVLIAAYLFTRSCPRLERWLITHPIYGRYLAMARGRCMPFRAKIITLAAMWASVATSVLLLTVGRDEPLPIVAAIVIVAAGVGTYFVVRLRTELPATA